MMSYKTPIMTKVISSTVQNRRIEISRELKLSYNWSKGTLQENIRQS